MLQLLFNNNINKRSLFTIKFRNSKKILPKGSEFKKKENI